MPVIDSCVDETWTILKVLDWTTERFDRARIEGARLEAQVLLSHALECDRVALYTRYDEPLPKSDLVGFRELIKRRLAGEPIAYLTGNQEFWSRAFAVDSRVLVPRRDTETLIEAVIDHIGERGAAVQVIDLCTGSGVIAVTLACELSSAMVVATDISDGALEVAAGNAARHAVSDRVEFLHANLWSGVVGLFDVVVSNPPYVRSGEIPSLSAEVRCEPGVALDGGVDGLDAIKPLVIGAPEQLKSGGLLAVEHGFDQGPAVAELFRAAGLSGVVTHVDLGGNPRVTTGQKL